MDGSTMGAAPEGGFLIGSAYVAVGADITPALQAVAQLRAEMASLAKGDFTVPMGAGAAAPGVVAPMAGPSQIASPMHMGASSSGGNALGIDTEKIRDELSRVNNEVRNLTASMEALQRASAAFSASGQAVPTEISGRMTQLGSQIASAQAASIQGNQMYSGFQFGFGLGGGYSMAQPLPENVVAEAAGFVGNFSFDQMAEAKAFANRLQVSHYRQLYRNATGAPTPLSMADVIDEDRPEKLTNADIVDEGRGRGRGGFNSSYINPFSLRGLGRMIGNMGEAWAGMEAVRVGASFARAYAGEPLAAYSHMAAMDRLGSPYNPRLSPATGARSEEFGHLQSVEEFQSALSSMPFVGPLLGALDFDLPSREARIQQIGRQDALAAYLPDRSAAAGVNMARAMGNPVAVARLAGMREVRAAREDVRRTYMDFGYEDPESVEARRIWKSTIRAADMSVEDAEVGIQAEFAGAHAQFAAAMPTLTLAGRDLGSIFRAEREEAAALRLAHRAQLMQPVQGLLRAVGQLDFGAIVANQAKIDTVLGAQRGQWADFTFRQFGATFEAEALIRNTGARMNSQVLRAGNDTYGAQMAEFEAFAEATKLAARPYGIDAGPALDIERRALQGRHTFEMQVATEGYSARRAAAAAGMGLQPMNAEAIMAVAQASHEVAMAAPEERADVMRTVAAELRTRQYLLTAQRGGEVAIDMHGTQALGMPSALGIDLTGRMQDLAAAGKTLQQGAAGLGSSPDASKTVNVTDKELKDVMTQLLGIWQKFKPAGVTMFQAN